jgi:tRNA A-37 threonylcarbamoyl transferase component Bud32
VTPIPGYEILGELGRGGMGVVYKARHLKLDRLVALKMILAGGHAGAGDLARFQTEAHAIARLQHPNIVQVYEVGEHEGKPFLALEFCAGGSLAQKLNGTPLPPREAAALMETLARAMQTAHEQHIIHRDLKPANVLLSSDGTPKVTDFGLAKRLDEAGQTQSGAVLGTPSYMAPEQAGGQPAAQARAIGPAADVWALGAILYECLSGRPPFKAATPLDTILQVISDEPVPPRRLNAQVPADLQTICVKCLQKEPAKRYVAAAAMADDLRRFAEGRPIVARPVGRLERAAKWVRRRPTVAGLLALVGFLAVGGAGAVGYFALEAQEAGTREANARANEAEERVRRAEDKARTTQAEREQVDSTLAQILARPLGYQDGPLTASERDALWEVARTKSDRVRLLFFDKALASPESAARLQRRADLAVQSAVGLDGGRRERLRALLLSKLRDGHEDLGVSEVCASLGVVLGGPDEAFARAACPALLAAMARTTDAAALHRQAGDLATLASWLPPAEAAQICAPEARHVLELMDKTTDADTLSLLGQALGQVGLRLGPAAATSVCAKGPSTFSIL